MVASRTASSTPSRALARALASLAKGRFGDGQVECPRHGACYDLRTGDDVGSDWLPAARTHAIELRHGDIYLMTAPTEEETDDDP